MKNVVVDPSSYDWEGDNPLQRPFAHTVIYEMHVGGLTKNPNSGVSPERRGTYLGVIDKIPYLKDLGITAVELLPVFQFDEQDAPRGLVNYWGYSPVSFFAPHHGYSTSANALSPLEEFRAMVKALHRSEIEVILDVVYNHTAEGNAHGPTLCFRGLENSAYYILAEKRAVYANFTGTGNTLNTNHPIVRRLIVESLRYWVREMHVDGFRFDLASILTRDEDGTPRQNSPVLWDIVSDPVLAGTKLIAEAWDAAGLYQVGSFVGDSWKEWNGKFRDDVRSFMRGDRGSAVHFAERMRGSPDIFGGEKREPERSINFITCHDGFTLNDLVTYNRKHNQTNGENNRDGSDYNLSWNYGVEGPSDDPAIETVRSRQVKNFMVANLLAFGAPMLLMGDEVRRTQQGNNNAYAQDNEISWFDWSLLDKHADLYRFANILVAYRLRMGKGLGEKYVSLSDLLSQARIQWHGVKLNHPDWGDDSHSLAYTVHLRKGRLKFHLLFNAYWEALDFELPSAGSNPQHAWRRWIETSLPSPQDIVEWADAPVVAEREYVVAPRSTVVLFARAEKSGSGSSI